MSSSSNIDVTTSFNTDYRLSSSPYELFVSHENPAPEKLIKPIYKPETPEWTLQCIVEDEMLKATGILRAWMPSCQC